MAYRTERTACSCRRRRIYLKKDLRIPNAVPGKTPHFVVTGEISSIYKKDGKTRKVHNIIILPSIEAADELSAKLEAIGNIHSDGRPILGLDSRDLLEITSNLSGCRIDSRTYLDTAFFYVWRFFRF